MKFKLEPSLKNQPFRINKFQTSKIKHRCLKNMIQYHPYQLTNYDKISNQQRNDLREKVLL